MLIKKSQNNNINLRGDLFRCCSEILLNEARDSSPLNGAFSCQSPLLVRCESFRHHDARCIPPRQAQKKVRGRGSSLRWPKRQLAEKTTLLTMVTSNYSVKIDGGCPGQGNGSKQARKELQDWNSQWAPRLLFKSPEGGSGRDPSSPCPHLEQGGGEYLAVFWNFFDFHKNMEASRAYPSPGGGGPKGPKKRDSKNVLGAKK